MFLAAKEIEFDAGHRVPDHEGKCSSPHGHRYKVVLGVKGELQDEGSRTGMVLDFAEIKHVLQEIHDKFDHGFMYSLHDHSMMVIQTIMPNAQAKWKWVAVNFSPTAENLAKWCFEYAQERFEQLNLPGEVAWAKVYETPTSVAKYPV